MPALIYEVRECGCCSVLTGVRILVAVSLVLGAVQLNGGYQSVRGTQHHIEELDKKEPCNEPGPVLVTWNIFQPKESAASACQKFAGPYNTLLVCSVITFANALLNCGIMWFAGFVVFGPPGSPPDRLSKIPDKMRLVRDLWLLAIVTDFLAPLPYLTAIWYGDLKTQGSPRNMMIQIVLHMFIQLFVALCFFLFVDTLDARVQAGGNGTEDKLSGELQAQATSAAAPLTNGKVDGAETGTGNPLTDGKVDGIETGTVDADKADAGKVEDTAVADSPEGF